jgi:hypothetical protein
MKAYEDMLSATSTEESPWYVIPADQKWLTRTLVSYIITQKIESLNIQQPRPSEEMMKALDEAKKKLSGE